MTISMWRQLRLMAAVVLAMAALITADLSTQGRRGRASVFVDGREAVDGEVQVHFHEAAAAFEQARAADDIEADEVESLGRRGTKRMRARRMNTQQLLARLRANPDVEFVEPNYIIRLAATPNDPSFVNLWGLFNFGQNYGGAGLAGADVDAKLAWDITTGSRANVIGIVDTGMDYNHPDLAANVWTAPSAFSVTIGGVTIKCDAGTHGFNAITNTCNPMDDHNHGTHVAGTIGAVGNNGVGVVGLNWTASMMALKFLDSSGSGTIANAVKAIEFAVQAKAVLGTNIANVRVLSNSWGGDGFSQSLLDEITRADSANMLFVAAAGNSNLNIDTSPTYPASYSAPNLITVAATNNLDQRASFSNYGATSVNLGAPGVTIQSTTLNNTYMAFSGTSMATPHVSGAAALVLSACSLTTAGLRAAILNAVDPIPAMAGITTTGGRLNVNNAIRSCAPPPPVSVPNVVGLTQAAATTSLTGAGLVLGTVTTAASPTVPAGNVISQTPTSGTSVAAGSVVNLTVSSGPAVTTRVNVAAATNGGTALASSTYSLNYPPAGAIDGNRRGSPWGGATGWNDATPGAGPDWLEIHFAGSQSISEVDVFSLQDAYLNPVEPALGQTFTAYGVIDFQVQYWTGAQWAVVPGGSIAGNTQIWRQLLFAPVTTTAIRITVTRTVDVWTRITEVEAYTTGATSSTVNVPNVVGLTQAAATTSLTGAGLVLGTVTTTTSPTVPAGNVISQTPTSGTSVAAGSAVNLTVSSGPAVTTRVNVAAATNGGTALASSTYSLNYPPAGAIDGNRRGAPWGGATGWNDATPGAGPDWLEIHFAGAQSISEVDVFSLQDAYLNPVEPVLGQTFTAYGLIDFQAQYWNGTQWTLIPGGSVAGNTQVWRQLLFAPVTTTAIRITVTRTVDVWTRITEVEAYTSTAGSTVSVPNVVGLTQAAATASLTASGLIVGTLSTASSPTVPAGSVISESPAGGTTVAIGSAVNLTVSSGPATTTRVNVAAAANGGTALASSFHSLSYPPAGAIDGNRRGAPWGGGTGWNDGTPNAGPDWLEIHFTSAQPIAEVDVFSLQDAYLNPVEPVLGQTFSLYGVVDFQVEYWTGTQWALVPGGSIAGNTQVWRQLLFAPVTTTAIRVTVNRTVDMWTRLTEVEAYTTSP